MTPSAITTKAPRSSTSVICWGIIDMNDAQLLQYFQNQQTQSGWFALLHTMVENMVANVGESQSHAFLTQMGDDLGKRFPLPLSNTVGELEMAINNQLARFNWGYIDID